MQRALRRLDLDGPPVEPLVAFLPRHNGAVTRHEWDTYREFALDRWAGSGYGVEPPHDRPWLDAVTTDVLNRALGEASEDVLGLICALNETAPNMVDRMRLGVGIVTGWLCYEQVDESDIHMLGIQAVNDARYRRMLHSTGILPGTSAHRAALLTRLGLQPLDG